jgi:hypothetical protein
MRPPLAPALAADLAALGQDHAVNAELPVAIGGEEDHRREDR